MPYRGPEIPRKIDVEQHVLEVAGNMPPMETPSDLSKLVAGIVMKEGLLEHIRVGAIAECIRLQISRCGLDIGRSYAQLYNWVQPVNSPRDYQIEATKRFDDILNFRFTIPLYSIWLIVGYILMTALLTGQNEMSLSVPVVSTVFIVVITTSKRILKHVVENYLKDVEIPPEYQAICDLLLEIYRSRETEFNTLEMNRKIAKLKLLIANLKAGEAGVPIGPAQVRYRIVGEKEGVQKLVRVDVDLKKTPDGTLDGSEAHGDELTEGNPESPRLRQMSIVRRSIGKVLSR